jgi:hypothetical protein
MARANNRRVSLHLPASRDRDAIDSYHGGADADGHVTAHADVSDLRTLS